jgi:hypothetical protein
VRFEIEEGKQMAGLNGQPSGEQGSVLIVVVVMLLALLVVSGVSILSAVISEKRIAVNLHLNKMAFYEADGGAQLGIQLIEDNIYHKGRRDGETVEGVTIDDGDFYMNPALPEDVVPCRDNRVAHFPDPDSDPPFTRIMVGGVTSLSTGSAILMLNGYGSAGRNAAGKGAWVTYNIRSQHVGHRESESIVDLFYRHVL